MYYIDEMSILLISLLAVIFADSFTKLTMGKAVSWKDFAIGWPRLIVSCFAALAFYGTIHTKWRYNDKAKPEWCKRAATAILQGVAWRTLIGGVK